MNNNLNLGKQLFPLRILPGRAPRSGKTQRRAVVTGMAVLASLALLLGAGAAIAKEKAETKKEEAPQVDENEILGEAYIQTKVEYPKFTFDDKKEWDNYEYVDGNKTAVIKGIERNADHTVVVMPRGSGFEPVTLTLKAADFKRTVVKTKGRTQTITFRAYYKVDFKKVEAPKADAKPAEGAK